MRRRGRGRADRGGTQLKAGVCSLCLGRTKAGVEQHPDCLRELFGTTDLPRIDLELPTVVAAAADMVGKMSISGVQEKVSVRLSPGGICLQLAQRGGWFILKPEPARFAGSTSPRSAKSPRRLLSVCSPGKRGCWSRPWRCCKDASCPNRRR